MTTEAENQALAVPEPAPVKKLTQAERIRLKMIGGDSKKNDVWVEYDGERYLLVPPKVRVRGQILEACVKFRPKKDAKGELTGETEQDFDLTELQVRALGACLRDADTRELVYPTAADREALLDADLTKEFDYLSQVAAKIINPRLKDVEKNSATAPGESSSTASPQS